LKTLYSFCAKSGCTDGEHPSAGLVQAANDEFYGTTGIGGAHADGTVFKITSSGTLTTLHSFVIRILGTDLTGATSVTFNGTPAAITFVSPSEIVTTVPAGATTGEVQVTTSGRTLSSNVPFQVLP
jgi:uncharacterized repeat protein (TIGR03803 family)